ncbi:MAG: hypothetical protein CBE33_04615 [Candidatus Pelagibacter sp. TMED273]|nr:MAG: hypothetical protein CBE33_04615 [Candidatus Pelagibacter sp. TMED273]|tara:strand:- start:1876 stop:3018 length:1143 start_codon:yes stop_codon:yes gene_type:complete
MNVGVHLQKYIDKKYLCAGNPHKHLDINKKYKFFIVIPCYNEFDYLFSTLESIDKQNPNLVNNTLVIIVINNSADSDSTVKNSNNKTYEKLIKLQFSFEFVAIDCFSNHNAFKNKLAGVGLARKVGLDFSLKFIENLNSIFCSLDADTIINENYLDIIDNRFKHNTVNAAVVNFSHQKSSNSIIEQGIRKYEKILKEIANNIQKTGSPYGYVSMGSTIVCNAKTYIAVGGMNTKKATEDFYFLQSIAKYTKVHKIKKVLVHPSSRGENRVYLGTGFRMDEYLKSKSFKNLNFSKESYLEIKKIIDIIDLHWSDSNEALLQKLMNNLNKKSVEFIKKKNISKVLKKFKMNAKNKNQFILLFNQWFDALTIMKFLKFQKQVN